MVVLLTKYGWRRSEGWTRTDLHSFSSYCPVARALLDLELSGEGRRYYQYGRDSTWPARRPAKIRTPRLTIIRRRSGIPCLVG